jgi:hypothetical protein
MANGNAAFERMGINVRDAQGNLRGTRDVLGEVADKFQTYSDGAGKAALAQELFGKAGADLIPLLNQGADGLAEMDRMAEQLGLTIDENTAQSAERFNDTLDLIGKGTTGIGRQIAAQLLPTLEGLAGQFLTTMTEGDKLRSIAEGISVALKSLYVVGLTVVEVFKTIGTAVGGTFAAIAAAVSGDFKGALNIMRDLKTDIGTSWVQTLEQAKKAWNTTGDAAVGAMVRTEKALAPVERATQRTAAATRDLKKATEDTAKVWGGWVPMLHEADSALTGVLSDGEMLAYVMSTEVAPAMDETAAETARLARAAEQAGINIAAAAQQATEAAPEWQKAWDQIAQSMTDALMDGGKNVGKMLQDLFRTIVLRPVLAPVGAALTGALAPGAANAGGFGSLLSGIGGFGSAAGAGLSNVLSGNIGGAFSAAGSLLGTGSFGGITSGLGMGLGAALPAIALLAALPKLKSTLFGGDVKDTGVIGTLGYGGISAEGYDLKTGGLFGNTSSSSRPIGAIGDALASGSAAMYAQVLEYAKVLKLPAEAVGAAKADFNFSTKGLSAEQIASKVQQVVGDYGEAMAEGAADFLRPLQKTGESFLDTLGRLAELETFSAQLANLGGAFGGIASSSLGARQALVDLMGGIDALAAASQSFVANYYTEAEQASIAARQVADALEAAGIDTSALSSRTDYRQMLESLNPETDSAQIAALLQNAESFASLSDYLASTADADTLATLAEGADAQLMQLQALTDSQTSGLETVTTAVTDGTASVVEAINGLGSVLAAANNAIAVYTQRTAQVLERVIPDGDALTVRTAT